jgi:hypothetical protein
MKVGTEKGTKGETTVWPKGEANAELGHRGATREPDGSQIAGHRGGNGLFKRG